MFVGIGLVRKFDWHEVTICYRSLMKVNNHYHRHVSKLIAGQTVNSNAGDYCLGSHKFKNEIEVQLRE
jgi:hypothetical protein